MPLSMVSLGMLFAFAFAMTSLSLLLLAGSGPPSFTAITISRPIIVKIFPFFASFFSFLCLILANFECPDIFFSPHFSCGNKPLFSFPGGIIYQNIALFPFFVKTADCAPDYVGSSRLIFRASLTWASRSGRRWQILSFSLLLSIVRICSSRITESLTML